MKKEIKNKLNTEKIILISIIILAIVLRIVFVLKTDIKEYQFDFGISKLESMQDYDRLYTDFDSIEDGNIGRHINYIMHLYTFGSLPNEIIGQFYHPPLHHAITALWLKVMDFFSDSSMLKMESIQVLPLIYSIVILFALYRILDELEIKNKIIPMLLFAFYPLFIFMSGAVNNDQLVTMFSVLTLLYLMKWSKNPIMKNAILMSIFLGLGMMTKTVIYILIVPAMFVYFSMLNKFVVENKKIGNMLIQLLIATIIIGVSGTWFHITRAMQNLNTIGIIQPYEKLSIAQYGFWERFGVFNIFNPNQININLWSNLINTSLGFVLEKINLIINAIKVILVLVIAFITIYYTLKNKQNKILLITLITWWLGYFYLNISMPYICSMHARYMVVPIYIGIIILSNGIDKEENKVIKNLIYFSTILLSLFSIVEFLMM